MDPLWWPHIPRGHLWGQSFSEGFPSNPALLLYGLQEIAHVLWTLLPIYETEKHIPSPPTPPPPPRRTLGNQVRQSLALDSVLVLRRCSVNSGALLLYFKGSLEHPGWASQIYSLPVSQGPGSEQGWVDLWVSDTRASVKAGAGPAQGPAVTVKGKITLDSSQNSSC